jgi:hypothetical protein
LISGLRRVKDAAEDPAARSRVLLSVLQACGLTAYPPIALACIVGATEGHTAILHAMVHSDSAGQARKLCAQVWMKLHAATRRQQDGERVASLARAAMSGMSRFLPHLASWCGMVQCVLALRRPKLAREMVTAFIDVCAGAPLPPTSKYTTLRKKLRAAMHTISSQCADDTTEMQEAIASHIP